MKNWENFLQNRKNYIKIRKNVNVHTNILHFTILKADKKKIITSPTHFNMQK